MNGRAVLFVGKPGCGKSTQGLLLAEATGWKLFSSGNLFRSIIREDTPLARRVKNDNDAGLLQPYWFATYLYLTSVFSVPDATGIVFDGFARTLEEAKLVQDSLRWLERPLSVVHLVVSDEVARERILKRHGEGGRSDDGKAPERLAEYRERTTPAIDFLRGADAFIELSGEGEPRTLSAEIRARLSLP